MNPRIVPLEGLHKRLGDAVLLRALDRRGPRHQQWRHEKCPSPPKRDDEIETGTVWNFPLGCRAPLRGRRSASPLIEKAFARAKDEAIAGGRGLVAEFRHDQETALTQIAPKNQTDTRSHPSAQPCADGPQPGDRHKLIRVHPRSSGCNVLCAKFAKRRHAVFCIQPRMNADERGLVRSIARLFSNLVDRPPAVFSPPAAPHALRSGFQPLP